jgi:hypothetical protein
MNFERLKNNFKAFASIPLVRGVALAAFFSSVVAANASLDELDERDKGQDYQQQINMPSTQLGDARKGQRERHAALEADYE